ncbi:hypothetical protein ACQ4M3_13185 [Leptolyngbya sp. AN03gr2]|uniref:hypothetical protein n=1 Tax=unclassified Leptolyngbya TaxID=2650499 RepID=UPI003D317683
MGEQILGFDPNHCIQVRWDNPLATFVGIITDRRIEAAIERGETDEEESDPIVLWVGGTPGEIPTIAQLKAILSPFVELSDETVARLEFDYNQAYVPSPLQQQTRQFIQANTPVQPSANINLPSLERLAALVDYADRRQLIPYEDGRKWVLIQNPIVTIAEVARAFLDVSSMTQIEIWANNNDIRVYLSLQMVPGQHFNVLQFEDVYFLKPC